MSRNSRSAVTTVRAFWVPLLLFVFAALLARDPLPFTSPAAPVTPMAAWMTDTTPVRRPTLRPDYHVAVFTYQCSDCHSIIPSPRQAPRTLTQHKEIELRHGINTHCLNCHHPTNRDAFVDDIGNEIPWNQPQNPSGAGL